MAEMASVSSEEDSIIEYMILKFFTCQRSNFRYAFLHPGGYLGCNACRKYLVGNEMSDINLIRYPASLNPAGVTGYEMKDHVYRCDIIPNDTLSATSLDDHLLPQRCITFGCKQFFQKMAHILCIILAQNFPLLLIPITNY